MRNSPRPPETTDLIDKFELFKTAYCPGRVISLFAAEETDDVNPLFVEYKRLECLVVIDNTLSLIKRSDMKEAVHDRLFDINGGFACGLVRAPLTPSCFLAHRHVLNVSERDDGKIVRVVVSGTIGKNSFEVTSPAASSQGPSLAPN